MTRRVRLREVVEEDVPIFFEHQRDPVANRMAAFGAPAPDDREAYLERWRKILADEAIAKRTIVVGDRVAGHLLRYPSGGHLEVGYWLGREHWGQGLASEALSELLAELPERPLYARAAADNLASLRVLEKCGFELIRRERSYANARGEEIEEAVLVLEAPRREPGTR